MWGSSSESRTRMNGGSPRSAARARTSSRPAYGAAPRPARCPGGHRSRRAPSATRPRPRRSGCAGSSRAGRASRGRPDAAGTTSSRMRRTTGDERLLDRTAAGDELLVGTELGGRREWHGTWRPDRDRRTAVGRTHRDRTGDGRAAPRADRDRRSVPAAARAVPIRPVAGARSGRAAVPIVRTRIGSSAGPWPWPRRAGLGSRTVVGRSVRPRRRAVRPAASPVAVPMGHDRDADGPGGRCPPGGRPPPGAASTTPWVAGRPDGRGPSGRS